MSVLSELLRWKRQLLQRNGWLSARHAVATACLLGLSACESVPKTVQTAASWSYDFDCDVPPGHSSQWDGPLPSNGAEVSGSIELIERREDPRWLPVANVLLADNANDPKVGLRLLVYRDKPTEIEIAVLDLDRQRTIIGSRPADAGPIAFSISLTQSGDVTIAAGGVSHSLELGAFKPTKLFLSCSTGQFKYTSILVTP